MPAKSSKSSGKVVPEKAHEWTRYWAAGEPPGASGNDDAYLLDPEGFFGRHAASGLVTLEEIAAGDFGGLLLCGDPGLGKTRTLERWRKQQVSSDTSLWLDVNFRVIPDRAAFEEQTFESETWQHWLAGWPAAPRQLTLVVDGVDEGTIKIPGFVAYLAGRLKDQPVNQLRLVVVCRSLDWPQSEGDQLMALWPAGPKRRKFELGRLRRADVQQAARDYGVDPDDFLHAVRTEGLDALAARPLTLRMLLAEFIRKGKFPPSRSELIRDYLRTMCQEFDPSRSRRVKTPGASGAKYSADDVYQTASWIAAMLLLGAKAEVQLLAATAQSRAELSVGDLTSDWQKSLGTIPAPELLRLTTQTPVFASRGANIATFQHQVFAELLAAEQLAGLPVARQVKLLSNRDGIGLYVEPPLAEVAAWLSTRSPGFRQHLLEHEPGLLLRADIAKLAPADKRALIDRLLAQARAGVFFDRWNERRYYQGLGHDKLADQLRSWIRDPSVGINARRLALTIAAACRCHAVFNDVFHCISDPADTAFHSACAFALAKLSRRRDAPRLLGVITAQPGVAERQVRLGCAIGLLETKAWTLRDVVPHLRQIVTAHSTDVHLLAQYCAPVDVPFILSEALSWPGAFDVGSMYYSLTRAGFRAAVDAWHRPAMRIGLAKLWLASTAIFGPPDDLMRAIAARAKTDEAGRRALIEAVAGLRILSGHELHCWIGRMLVHADLPWMLQRIRALPPVAQQNFAAGIRALYCRNYSPEFFDPILAVRKVVPALAAEFDWLRTWQLDEPAAIAAKAFYAQSQAAVPPTEPIDPPAVWERDLRTLQGGSMEVWVWASDNLFFTGENQGVTELEADVTRAPGWQHHSASARRSLREAARCMLLSQPGEPNFSLNQVGQWGVAGYRAIVLLRATLSRDAALRAAVKRHWIPTILNWFGSDDGGYPELVRLAYRLDRLRVFRFLDDELARAAVSQEGLVVCLRKYVACWDQKLGNHVREWVLRYPQLRPQVLASLMRELREIDARLALELCEQVVGSPDFEKDRKAALLGAWVETEIWGSWAGVKKMLSDPEIARAAFLAAAVHYNVEARKMPKRMKATMLEEMYLKLRALFPIADDDPIPSRTFTPTPRMDVAQWRNRLPQIIAAQATLEACRALLRLIAVSEDNERTWIQMRLRDAIEGKRRQQWRPAPVAELRLELLRAS